jgi:hypothetical protein
MNGCAGILLKSLVTVGLTTIGALVIWMFTKLIGEPLLEQRRCLGDIEFFFQRFIWMEANPTAYKADEKEKLGSDKLRHATAELQVRTRKIIWYQCLECLPGVLKRNNIDEATELLFDFSLEIDGEDIKKREELRKKIFDLLKLEIFWKSSAPKALPERRK